MESTTTSNATNDDNSRTVAPQWMYRLNAATKWYITVANTAGIWLRVPQYEGPLVVVGAIASVYLTDVLKRIFNQNRPADAPFADPGMPSSHALVSCFLAAAWSGLWLLPQQQVGASAMVWTAAAMTSVLRVTCGYHTRAQIAVGAVVGSALGAAWAAGSAVVYARYPRATAVTAWTAYVAGSALFIVQRMTKWVTEEKHL